MQACAMNRGMKEDPEHNTQAYACMTSTLLTITQLSWKSPEVVYIICIAFHRVTTYS